MRRAALTTAAFAVCAVASTASAEISLLEGETYDLRLGGYVGTFSAYQWTGYDTSGLAPEEAGLNASVVRLEWKANLTDTVALDVQNRLFWSLGPAGATAGAVGLGSTVPPERTLDLRRELVEGDGLLLEHDLDRLALTFFTGVADVTVGRQAVTWGTSNIFTIADLWTQFSPFELDTSQKRGVDALRILSYPLGSLELDMIVVDRGDVDHLSGGVRVGWILGSGDYYLAGGRNYETIWGLMGMTLDLGELTGRGELALPYDPEEGDLRLPRATLGVDYFSSKFTAMLEYHFNGLGAGGPSGYVDQLTSTAFARGERYFLGRHYVGIVGAYLPWEDLVTLSASTIVNMTDPSVLISPSLAYQLSQNTTATLGGYFGFGDDPTLDLAAVPPLRLGSEFGLYGNVVFLQVTGYL